MIFSSSGSPVASSAAPSPPWASTPRCRARPASCPGPCSRSRRSLPSNERASKTSKQAGLAGDPGQFWFDTSPAPPPVSYPLDWRRVAKVLNLPSEFEFEFTTTSSMTTAAAAAAARRTRGFSCTSHTYIHASSRRTRVGCLS